MTAPTPRVAESIDDLRVGQVLVTRDSRTGHWTVARYMQEWADKHTWDFSNGRVVILSDPPPEPVTVSREAFDRLIDELDTWSTEKSATRVVIAARILVNEALVDEVRAAE